MMVQIPLILALSPVVGCAIGWAIDRVAGTRPIFTLVLLSAGFAAGVKETWTIIRRSSSDNSDT